MWRRHIETCINNKTPSTITKPQGKNSIKRHFYITRKRKRAGRLKKTGKRNLAVIKNRKQQTIQNVRKRIRAQ